MPLTGPIPEGQSKKEKGSAPLPVRHQPACIAATRRIALARRSGPLMSALPPKANIS